MQTTSRKCRGGRIFLDMVIYSVEGDVSDEA